MVDPEKKRLVRIETVLELLMGQDDFVPEFAEASIISFKEFSDEFSKHLAAKDLDNLRRAGHKIRPVAQMLELHQVVEEYETGKQILESAGDENGAAESRLRMTTLCDRIIHEFEALLRPST